MSCRWDSFFLGSLSSLAGAMRSCCGLRCAEASPTQLRCPRLSFMPAGLPAQWGSPTRAHAFLSLLFFWEALIAIWYIYFLCTFLCCPHWNPSHTRAVHFVFFPLHYLWCLRQHLVHRRFSLNILFTQVKSRIKYIIIENKNVKMNLSCRLKKKSGGS